jgi:hypothetical protein
LKTVEKVRIEKVETKKIRSSKIVKMYKMNHIIELISVEKEAKGGLTFIKKINKNEYVDTRTAEVKEYKKSVNRSNNIQSLKKSFVNLRRLINNNFSGCYGEKHITLTYKDNMTCSKTAYKDFDKFIKKMKYRYKGLEYIVVLEPQQRGAWHFHLLLKSNERFIDNTLICDLWGRGFTKTQNLSKITNVGAYLSAYLTDIEINESEGAGGVSPSRTENKKIKKGGRLHLYKSSMKLFRCSRGIKKVVPEMIIYSEVKKKVVGMAVPYYSRTLKIFLGEKLLNEITYEQYNLKVRKNQTHFKKFLT